MARSAQHPIHKQTRPLRGPLAALGDCLSPAGLFLGHLVLQGSWGGLLAGKRLGPTAWRPQSRLLPSSFSLLQSCPLTLCETCLLSGQG